MTETVKTEHKELKSMVKKRTVFAKLKIVTIAITFLILIPVFLRNLLAIIGLIIGLAILFFVLFIIENVYDKRVKEYVMREIADLIVENGIKKKFFQVSELPQRDGYAIGFCKMRSGYKKILPELEELISQLTQIAGPGLKVSLRPHSSTLIVMFL